MMAILTALDAAPANADDVAAHLTRDYELEVEGSDSVSDVVTIRLAELARLGLIDAA